jgi:threonine/homoserine/homoserine lactone efflux protein
MPGPLLFVSLSLALLLTPGPTNTLLAVAGAGRGLRPSLPLMLAELLGYLLSIHVLVYGIGPFVQAVPIAQTVMRLACALCLLALAIALWRSNAPLVTKQVINPGRVFTVTLLNPKALVFAFVVLPGLPGRWLALAPYLAGLSVMILGASLVWISFGAAISNGRIVRVSPQAIRKTGAAILLLFAVLIAASHLALPAA